MLEAFEPGTEELFQVVDGDGDGDDGEAGQTTFDVRLLALGGAAVTLAG
ncbi:hypothetical protein ABZ915_43810 [Streptomyces sp. NPDC046915]